MDENEHIAILFDASVNTEQKVGGVGYVIERRLHNRKEIKRGKTAIKSDNSCIAEAMALREGIKDIISHNEFSNVTSIMIRGDNKNVIDCLSGNGVPRGNEFERVIVELKEMIERNFEEVIYCDIRRESNEKAHILSRQARRKAER